MNVDRVAALLLNGLGMPGLLAGIRKEREEADHAAAPRFLTKELLDDYLEMGHKGVDPRVRLPIPQNLAEWGRRYKSHALVPELDNIAREVSALPGTDRMVALIDQDGLVLDKIGDPSMVEKTERFCLKCGVNWAGLWPATNAVRLAVRQRASTLLLGPHHWNLNQHQVACAVSPVFDSTGRLAGYLDLVCPAEAMTVDLARLVDALALNLRPVVDRTRYERLRRLRQEARRLRLRCEPRRYLVIDWYGYLAVTHDWDANDRVTAPEGGFTLGLNEVPELGHVVLEPVWGGWLVRPDEKGDGPEFALTVDLRQDNPSRDRAAWVRLDGPVVSWPPQQLSLRQAEIMVLLVESGRAGLDQDQLESELYPVPPAPGTARVACKRVRDALRSVLLSHPYRVADTVRVTVQYPENMADLLPGSVAPGIVRLRRQRRPHA